METKSPTNSKRKEPRWLKLKVSVANDLDSEEYKIESLRVNSSLTPSAAKLSKDGFEINERGVLMTPPHIRKRSLSFETKRVSSQSCLSIDSCVPSRYEKTATDSLNFETLSIDPIKIQSEEPSDIKLSHFVSFGSRIGKGSTAIVRRCVHVKCESPKVYATKSIQMSEEKKTRQLTNELTTYFRIFSDSNSREVPGILGFYEAFYHDGVAILILEYMNRGTLESMINEYGKIPEKLLCLLAKQILLGLETLHRNNQVHRDIKPGRVFFLFYSCIIENILLNTFGMAKIADFGIVADLYGQSRLYCFEFVGTNKWMSPERILAQPYSFASDIWSFGLVLVKCATGKFAYQSENGILGLIQRITKQDPPKLDESTFSPNLCSFVSKWFVIVSEVPYS